MSAAPQHPGWIIIDTTCDMAVAHYRDHADADRRCEKLERLATTACATDRRYRYVSATPGADTDRYLKQIRMAGGHEEMPPRTPLASWQTMGEPEGRRIGRDGTRYDHLVRWDMDTSAPGMGGVRSVGRRFATAVEAIAAVEAGMGIAFRATAFGPGCQQIATRRNLRHHRNRRAGQAA